MLGTAVFRVELLVVDIYKMTSVITPSYPVFLGLDLIY